MSDLITRLQSVQAILFDLDGTLVHTENRWAVKYARKLAFVRKLSPRLDPQTLGRGLVNITEMPVNYLLLVCEHLGISTSFFGLADRLRRSKGLATRGESALIPGSLRLLQSLGNYRLAAVTTRAQREATAFIAPRRPGVLFLGSDHTSGRFGCSSPTHSRSVLPPPSSMWPRNTA